jgi:hypothetical protein
MGNQDRSLCEKIESAQAFQHSISWRQYSLRTRVHGTFRRDPDLQANIPRHSAADYNGNPCSPRANNGPPYQVITLMAASKTSTPRIGFMFTNNLPNYKQAHNELGRGVDDVALRSSALCSRMLGKNRNGTVAGLDDYINVHIFYHI